MTKGYRFILCVILAVGILILPSVHGMGETADMNQLTYNETIDYQSDLPLVSGALDPNYGYLIGLHQQEIIYDPSTVIISGSLYAEKGMEILSATVVLEDGPQASGESLVRFTSTVAPEQLDLLKDEHQEIDSSRSGFAFVADFSGAGLTSGTYKVSVQLVLSSSNGQSILVQNDQLSTMIDVASGGKLVYDIVYMLTGVQHIAIYNGETGDAVVSLQRNLIALNYLCEDQATGSYDDVTQEALRSLCKENELIFDETGVTQTADRFIASGLAIAKPEEPKNLWEKGLVFLQSELQIGDLDLPYWVLSAAAAGIILIVVVILLMVPRRKKEKDNRDMEPLPISQQGKIINVDDNATVTEFHLRMRMDFSNQYLDIEKRFCENESLIIGRGQEAQLKTNPADVVVSHKHGVFEVKNGIPCYTDTSTNGTGYADRILHNETVELPRGVRFQMEIGRHRILVIID